MDRTERFYKIDRLLKDSKSVSFGKLEEALGVSRATLKRDLLYMRDRFNAPIEYDREANGYRFGKPRNGPRYELPGLWFSATEGYALLATLKLLGDLQPGLLEGQLTSLVERLRSVVGRGDHSWAEVEKRVRIFQPERRVGDSAHFGTVAAGTLQRRRVWIRHFNRAEGAVTEREVSPQRLILYRDNWYLDTYCHLRHGLRSFAVDAIQDAELRDTVSKEVSAAQLDEYLSGGYGIFAGRELAWATLKFSPKAARWVASQSWHPKQRSRTDVDGSYVLEIPYADDRELLMEILKYGVDIEVVAPEALRGKVLAVLKEAAGLYS
jgi:predicted DNA-binding transcriptional regulator YafY